MKSVLRKKGVFAILAALFVFSSVFGRENVPATGSNTGGDGQKLNNINKVMTGCQQGTTQTEIKLNNVRTRILTCGDMWWDVNSNPKYEVPKGSGSYACFAGSLWFGGYVNGQLRISAMTYRQTGIDFWPGPLDPVTANVDASTCTAYDKHWRFNRADVDEFYNKYAAAAAGIPGATADPSYSVPAWIKDYPGSAPTAYDTLNGSLYNYLAPFEESGANPGVYNWEDGDFPRYNVTSAQVTQGNCKRYLFGDETLFWVFNDKGNNHTESGSVASIGVEIRAQGFEFATSDVLNDMSFYNFEIINRSTNILDSTYFAVWVDADLGNYNDDYVGCDVVRGLGYIYNGDNFDENSNGVIGYGQKLPALGCDFFQGPNADVNDGIDNDRDGCIDCTFYIDGNGIVTSTQIDDDTLPEHISMSKFVPYNNTGDARTGNPLPTGNGIQYYRYMDGKWKSDGTPMRYDNGNGTSSSGPPCDYLYPGDSDPIGYGVGGSPASPATVPHTTWTENNSNTNNQPGDRRFLQSAGKFTLQPGAINVITFGMPFVRTNSDNNFAAIPLLLIADDKAQSLFDNCFKVLDGPDAPNMTIQELENQLIFYFSNKESSNNYEQDRYAEVDPTITPIFGAATDKSYRFEGYMVFQLKDGSVSASDLYDENKSRLVFQCDKKNGVSTLINYTTDPTLGSVPKLMTPEANDNGIVNSFMLTEDMFAEGNKTLVNHKTYYYMSIAYAYNNYLTYKQDVSPGIDTSGNDVHPASGDYTGQKKPFLQGRRNVRVYSAIPHNINPEANGTVINSAFGFGPKVTRIEGQGNGGRYLDLTSSSINNILANNLAPVIEYENNSGPIGVKVIDPLKVLSGNFAVKLKKVIPGVVVKDSLVAPDPNDLDSGKVRGTYKYEVSGTYTNSAGASVTKTWNSDEIIELGQEYILIGDEGDPIGISVTVSQDSDPTSSIFIQTGVSVTTGTQYGPSTVKADLLGSSLTFASSDTKWLTGVVDLDGPVEQNWIRSGLTSSTDTYDDAQLQVGSKTYYSDPEQIWESVVGGTWAPFRVTAKFNPNSPTANTFAPSLGYKTISAGVGTAFSKYANRESNTSLLESVDIVFTNDQSKWTRCVVIEMGNNIATNVGGAKRFLPRRQRSVDKNGLPGDSIVSTTDENDADYISPFGMGWFPGYAINVETGERLNIAFGENSSMVSEHGADMIWNPTGNTYMPGSNTNLSFGGMHYIYVFGHNSDGMSGSLPIDVPRYDKGEKLFTMLNQTIAPAVTNNSYTTGYGKTGIVEAYKDAMWVNIPLIASGYTGNFAANSRPNIPCDAKVRIRVRKPLRYGWAGTWAPTYSAGTSSGTNLGTVMLGTNSKSALPVDTSATPQNYNFPMYTFSTDGLGASINQTDVAASALDIINVVPNPYYGHSQYEQTRIDNYIKIVNLPVKCTIRIYSINGTLIRTIKKNTDATTDVSWDLKNEKNILVTSGMYIIHVDAGDLGEKILKWFCVMRPIDLQSY